MPRPFLTVPVKATEHFDFKESFSRIIRGRYEQNPVDFEASLNELSSQRDRCLLGTLSVHENGIKAIYRYYAQLQAFLSLFPDKVTTVGAPFKWNCVLFERTGYFSSPASKQSSVDHIGFELANVLFNIASLHSQIAAQQDITTDQGRKTAMIGFQTSSLFFDMTLTTMQQYFLECPLLDLNQDVLKIYSDLMKAQSQEVFYHRIVAEGKSEGSISKIAIGASQLIDNVIIQIKRQEFDQNWKQLLLQKKAFYAGEGNFRDANTMHQQCLYGEEIARLRQANQQFEIIAASPLFDCQALIFQINKQLTTAENENSAIYFKSIPPFISLPVLDKYIVTIDDKSKYIPDWLSYDIIGDNLFAKLPKLTPRVATTPTPPRVVTPPPQPRVATPPPVPTPTVVATVSPAIPATTTTPALRRRECPRPPVLTLRKSPAPSAPHINLRPRAPPPSFPPSGGFSQQPFIPPPQPPQPPGGFFHPPPPSGGFGYAQLAEGYYYAPNAYVQYQQATNYYQQGVASAPSFDPQYTLPSSASSHQQDDLALDDLPSVPSAKLTRSPQASRKQDTRAADDDLAQRLMQLRQ